MTTAQTTITKQANDIAITKGDRIAVVDVSRMQAIAPAVNLSETALEYVKAGLSVIPVTQKKTPAIAEWTSYQHTRPSNHAIRSWQLEGKGLAIICGQVSGNFEVIDFDEKYNNQNEDIYARWKEMVDEHRTGLVDRLGLETTQSGGYHIFYRCTTIAGNQKLAEREATEDDRRLNAQVRSYTLIEHVGKGDILCVPRRKDIGLSEGVSRTLLISTPMNGMCSWIARRRSTSIML